MMVVAVAVAILGGWLGLLVSYHGSIDHGWRLASGATVVLVDTLVFAVAWVTTIAVARTRPTPVLA